MFGGLFVYVSSSEQCLVDCLCVSALLSVCGGLFVSFSEQCLVVCVSTLLSSVWWIVSVCQLF